MTDRTTLTAAEARAERIRRIVDQAPPLSDETRRRVTALLRAPDSSTAPRSAAA